MTPRRVRPLGLDWRAIRDNVVSALIGGLALLAAVEMYLGRVGR